jgi:hypothetical protein
MTDIDVGRAAILDLGFEDYYHLGDAATYLPTIAADRRADVAREAMRQLLTEGLVELYFGKMASNDVAIVPLSHALKVLDDPRAWDGTHHPNSYCFANTDAGGAAYLRGHVKTPGRHQPNER